MHQRPLERVVVDVFVDEIDDFCREADSVMIALVPVEVDSHLVGFPARPAFQVVDEHSDFAQRSRGPGANVEPKVEMVRHYCEAMKRYVGIALHLSLDCFENGLADRV